MELEQGTWMKAAASSNGGTCVEIMKTDTGYRVADTKQDGSGPVLEFDDAEWAAFTEGVRSGEWTPSRP